MYEFESPIGSVSYIRCAEVSDLQLAIDFLVTLRCVGDTLKHITFLYENKDDSPLQEFYYFICFRMNRRERFYISKLLGYTFK